MYPSKLINRLTAQITLFTLCMLSPLSLQAQGNSGNANGQPFEALQAQIDELNSRIDALELGTSATFTVDCDAGDSVADAIASVPLITPVEITIEGLCNEALLIQRDDVTIQGATPADGFLGQAGGTISTINGPSRVFLRDLTIDSTAGSFYSIGCFQGSAVQTNNVTILGGSNGYLIVDGGQCRIVDGVVDGASTGVLALSNGFADIEGSSIINSAGNGILAISASSIRVQSSASGNSSLVADNNTGLSIRTGSHLDLNGAVDSNSNNGVEILWGATARITGNHPIQNNGGNGISLDTDVTVVQFGNMAVTGNGNWGIQCINDSHIVGNLSVASGNGAGEVDCP